MRAIVYIRLSEETETTTSPARQLDICSSYARSRDWEITAVIEDIDVSATKTGLDRPGLSKLRKLVAEGQADVVIIWRMDRLARSVLDTLILLREFTEAGVATASATEPVDLTTPVGKAMVALIAIFAEMEADAIKARVRGSIDTLRKGGRFAGGTVPYGYIPVPNPDGPGRVLAIEPTEAEVIREAAKLVRDGHSLGYIGRQLNDADVPAPRSEYRRLARAGKPTDDADRGDWRVQSLRRLLVSDHLAGRVTHRGELLRDKDGLPLEVWPPIIGGAQLAHLRDLLEPDEARPRVRRARLLSGLVRCSVCKSKMYANNGGKGYFVYRCPTRSNGGNCPSPRVSADGLERHVVTEALEVLSERPLTRTVPLTTEAGASRTVTFQEIEEAIAATTVELQADEADVPALVARLAALKQRRTDLKTADSPAVIYVLEETGETWGEAFSVADTDAQRLLLEEEIDAVWVSPTESRSKILDPSRVEIAWTPDDPTT